MHPTNHSEYLKIIKSLKNTKYDNNEISVNILKIVGDT